MEPQAFLDFLHRLERLKCNTRHSWTSTGRHESVAEHCLRLATMALLLRDEFKELDMDRVLRMCLVHDWGEAVTGDIPCFLKTEANERTEDAAIAVLINELPERARGEYAALFAEMAELSTPEARLYKALDKIESVIQHNEAPIETWLPLERELNLSYAREECAEFPFMAALRALAERDTREKIGES